jgi:hypothetical protein
VFVNYRLIPDTVFNPERDESTTVLFSVSLKVLSQGNLRRRSLKGSRSATTGWLTYTTLNSGFCSFICDSSLSDYKLEY